MRKKILQKIKNSFQLKLMIVIIICVLTPLFITLGISYQLYHNLIESEIEMNNKRQLDWTVNSLQGEFAGIDQSVIAFYVKSDIYDFFNKKTVNLTDSVNISNQLDYFCYSNQMLSNAYAINDKKEVVYSAYSQFGENMNYEKVKDRDWYQEVKDRNGYHIRFFQDNQGGFKNECLLYLRPLYQFENAKCQGAIGVRIKIKLLEDSLKTLNQQEGYSYIIDANGRVICSAGHDAAPDEARKNEILQSVILNPNKEFIKNNGDYIFYQKCSNTDFYVVNVILQGTVDKSALVPYLVGTTMVVMFLLIGLAILLFLIRRMVNPINHLAATLQKADPNHLTTIEVSKCEDEVGILERSYNNMVIQYNDLLENHYKAKLQKKMAQLKALQFQINPHFVNNTLQMIGTKAIENKVPAIYKLLKSFSNMFYYCIKYKDDVVTMKDELAYLQDYILLQQERFPDKIKVRQAIDKRSETCLIPKMTLQPILENCFVHGFSKKKDIWEIQIAVVQFERSYEIMIKDNGCGMDKEQLVQLRETLCFSGDGETYDYSGSIGIQNVNARIRLLYGEGYGLSVDSCEGEETSVIIKLPL